MSGLDALVALRLITLHTVDGSEIHISPSHVVSIRNARESEDPRKLLIGTVRCVIMMSNGKFTTVIEDCDTVRRMIEELSKSP